MNYLVYIEYSAENLQFFLWYRDYVKRFNELPRSERTLAPEWTAEQAEAETLTSQATAAAATQIPISKEAAAILNCSDFVVPSVSMVELKSSDPFHTPPRTPTTTGSIAQFESAESEHGSTAKNPGKSFQHKAAGAFAEADLKWQPCTLFQKKNSHLLTERVQAKRPWQSRFSLSEKKSLVSLQLILPTALLDSSTSPQRSVPLSYTR